jgi:ribosomal protein L16/L10AE
LSGFIVNESCVTSLNLKLRQLVKKSNFDMQFNFNVHKTLKGQMRMGKGKGKKKVTLSYNRPGSVVLFVSAGLNTLASSVVSNRVGAIKLKVMKNNFKFLKETFREL